MLVIDAIFVVFLFLYFWYMTGSHTDSVSKPAKPYSPSRQAAPNPILSSHGDHYHFEYDQYTWETPLPDHYAVHDAKIIPRDVCHGQTDGQHVLATGQALYQFLQQDKLVSFTQPFEADALSTLQDKHVFYFTCQGNQIHELHMCPPGHVFRFQDCHAIDMCAHQPDGTLFPNPFDAQSYFQCQRELAVPATCSPKTYFVHDECKEHDFNHYCQHHTEPKVLEPKSLLVCQQGKVTFETCPPGFRYFDLPTCETEACVGQPDGQLLALPNESVDSFTYSPGFMTCKANKMDKVELCPSQWDSYLGDRLPFLPQVFDGHQCTVPEFCTNVHSTDPDVIVPVYEFTKHVRNWKHAKLFDQVTGIQCEGTTRKRVALDPGERINKRMKRESACDANTQKVVVSENPDAYFDCATRVVEKCPENHFFNGFACTPRNPHAHSYRDIDLFAMDSLSPDNWIKPWDYARKDAPVILCTDPSFIFNETYNLCSHPDCVHYPFLSQISFKINLLDNSECVFQKDTRLMIKQPTSRHYLYWSQRPVDDPFQDEDCVPGQNMQSGHFVFDKTLFATCDDSQPFVFCPSSDTDSIYLIEGQRWACIPSIQTFTIPPNTKRQFIKNEVYAIERSYHRKPVSILLNGVLTSIPRDGLKMSNSQGNIHVETQAEGVSVEMEHFNTHPPDVAFHHNGGIVSPTGGAYLIKLKAFTKKPVDLPDYKIEPSVTDFLFNQDE